MIEITDTMLDRIFKERKRKKTFFCLKDEDGRYWEGGSRYSEYISRSRLYNTRKAAIHMGKELKRQSKDKNIRIFLQKVKIVECGE